MKVWCLEHDSEIYPVKSKDQIRRCYLVLCEGNWKIDAPCRFVEMQLVPTDARVVSGELQCPNCKFVYEPTNV